MNCRASLGANTGIDGGGNGTGLNGRSGEDMGVRLLAEPLEGERDNGRFLGTLLVDARVLVSFACSLPVIVLRRGMTTEGFGFSIMTISGSDSSTALFSTEEEGEPGVVCPFFWLFPPRPCVPLR